MTTIKVVLRKSKISEAGLAPLYLRFTRNRKVTFLSLQLFIKPSDWDEKTARVKKSHLNSTRLNALLSEKLAEAERASLDFAAKRINEDPVRLKDKLVEKETGTFTEFVNSYLERMEKMSTVGSYRRVKTVIAKFQASLNDETVLLSDFSLSILKDYEQYLSISLKNSANTINANFKVLRRLFNEAEITELIGSSENPFKRFKTKTVQSKRDLLSWH